MKSDRRGFLKSGAALAGGLTFGAVTPASGQTPGNDQTPKPEKFIKAGKESYYIVSKFEHFEYAKVAPLFSRMAQDFERLVYGLNQVKNELQELQHPIARRTQQLLM